MKRKISFLAIGLVIGLLVGCGATASAEQDKPLKIWLENQNGVVYTYKVVDSETGVNYVVTASRYNNGYPIEAMAMCPRYNADGSLYAGK